MSEEVAFNDETNASIKLIFSINGIRLARVKTPAPIRTPKLSIRGCWTGFWLVVGVLSAVLSRYFSDRRRNGKVGRKFTFWILTKFAYSEHIVMSFFLTPYVEQNFFRKKNIPNFPFKNFERSFDIFFNFVLLERIRQLSTSQLYKVFQNLFLLIIWQVLLDLLHQKMTCCSVIEVNFYHTSTPIFPKCSPWITNNQINHSLFLL